MKCNICRATRFVSAVNGQQGQWSRQNHKELRICFS